VLSLFKGLIFACLFLCLLGPASIKAAPSGFLEGHLKIILSREVDLADGTPASGNGENYAEYPLIVLDKNNGKEVTRVTADTNGNYRVALPPGDYVLDVRLGANGRPLGHLRAEPHPFTILPNQTVRVDMDIDTGIR
jgi:hypothetical protein